MLAILALGFPASGHDASAELPLIDFFEIAPSASTFVAYRVLVPPGRSYQLDVKGVLAGGTSLWSFASIYELPSLQRIPAPGGWSGLVYAGDAVLYAEAPVVGTALNMRRDWPIGQGNVRSLVDGNGIDFATERLVVGMLVGRGRFAGNFTLAAEPDVILLGRTAGSASLLSDVDGDFHGGATALVLNPQAFVAPLPVGGGLKAEVGTEAGMDISHGLFGLFVGFSNSRVQRFHVEGPEGQEAVGPCICLGVPAGQYLRFDAKPPGEYKFHIDYQMDVQAFPDNVNVIAADVPVP